jgi:hypothetical protein
LNRRFPAANKFSGRAFCALASGDSERCFRRSPAGPTYTRYPHYPQADSASGDSFSMTAFLCGRNGPSGSGWWFKQSHTAGADAALNPKGEGLRNIGGHRKKDAKRGEGASRSGCGAADPKHAGGAGAFGQGRCTREPPELRPGHGPKAGRRQERSWRRRQGATEGDSGRSSGATPAETGKREPPGAIPAEPAGGSPGAILEEAGNGSSDRGNPDGKPEDYQPGATSAGIRKPGARQWHHW